jgi:hypothetical protein
MPEIRRNSGTGHVGLSERRRRLLGTAKAARCSYLIVFFVAFGLRLLVPLTSRGLVGNYSYDASVHYSAGAAVVHGRVPYRDFILLHPPGVVLAVAPAAWIGLLTSDRTGYALATLEFAALGATSAVLVQWSPGGSASGGGRQPLAVCSMRCGSLPFAAST